MRILIQWARLDSDNDIYWLLAYNLCSIFLGLKNNELIVISVSLMNLLKLGFFFFFFGQVA